MNIVLAITQDSTCASNLRDILEPDHDLTLATSWNEGLEIHRKRRHDFTFVDMNILKLKGNEPQSYFDEAFKPYFKAFPTTQIIVMTSAADTRNAVGAVKAGASEFITFPLVRAEIQLVLERITERLRRTQELEMLRDEFWKDEAQSLVRSSSPAMQEVIRKVKKVAGTKLTVLITGETGTGKSMLAKLIHLHSPRREKQFISVHCGAIPESLVESELFGHEKGSFTGADRRKLGRFEVAHQGTVFLDEIDSVSMQVQVKLLQILQEGTFRRVGGEQEQSADLRMMAATNGDLTTLTREGRFREDLFFRLNVFPIHMPPLRERHEDIPHLVGQFIARHNSLHGSVIQGITEDALESMRRYSWPGNIRELEHMVERACVLEPSDKLTTASFPFDMAHLSPPGKQSPPVGGTLSEARERSILEAERTYLMKLLDSHHGRMGKASLEAGITARQLYNLMKRHGMRKEDFKKAPSGRSVATTPADPR